MPRQPIKSKKMNPGLRPKGQLYGGIGDVLSTLAKKTVPLFKKPAAGSPKTASEAYKQR